MSRATPFYATPRDLSSVVRDVSATTPLSFTVAGLFDIRAAVLLEDFERHEPLQTYLVLDRGAPVAVRRVPQRRGADKFAVDQLLNPHTVAIRCGGVMGDSRLIAGQLGTTAEGGRSAELYALLVKSMKRQFEKIRSYLVGPEAARLLDQGWHLAPTERSPPEYDLAR